MVQIVGLEAANVDSLNSSVSKALSAMIQALVSQENAHCENEEHWIRLLAAFPLFVMRTDIVALQEDLAKKDSVVNTWRSAMKKMKLIPVPEEFTRLKATVIEKRGHCEVFELGDTFDIQSPFYWPRPCSAVWLSLWPYIIAAGFGYRSWEKNDSTVFRISCPSKKGLVFEICTAVSQPT